jgi:hypothetical protein
MESGLDLKAFLQQQTAEGLSDSEGQFTVAREKALTKLGHFALPDKVSWVLKIVQAANLWQAPGLIVRQSRVATSFFLCPPTGSEFPSESAILSALNAIALSADRPVHQLAVALRSLVQQCGLSFVLAVRRGGQLCQPIFAGDDTSELGASVREKWAHLQQEGVRLTVSHFRANEGLSGRYVPTLTRVPRRDRQILKALQTRCFPSGTPIEVDGRRITGLFPTGQYELDRRWRPVLRGALEPDSLSGYRLSALDLISAREKGSALRIEPVLGEPGESSFLALAPEWRTLLPVHRRLEGILAWAWPEPEIIPLHTVWLVRQGVVVQRARLRTVSAPRVVLQVCLSADHLRVDLSGLNVGWKEQAGPAIQSGLQTTIETVIAVANAGFFEDSLLAKPEEKPPEQQRATPNLDLAGNSLLTRSILFSLPSPRRQMLRALDRGAPLLERHASMEEAIAKWAELVRHEITRRLSRIAEGEAQLVRDPI